MEQTCLFLSSFGLSGKKGIGTALRGDLVIWKERNRRCFEGRSLCVESLVDKVKFYVALWVSILPRFHDFSLSSIIIS